MDREPLFGDDNADCVQAISARLAPRLSGSMLLPVDAKGNRYVLVANGSHSQPFMGDITFSTQVEKFAEIPKVANRPLVWRNVSASPIPRGQRLAPGDGILYAVVCRHN